MVSSYPLGSLFERKKLTIPEDALAQVTTFLDKLILRRTFFNLSLCIPMFWCDSPKPHPTLWQHSTPKYHDLNKHESIPYEDASTQITELLAKWFFRRIFLYIFLSKTPNCDPALPGIMIWTNLNLHHMRMLPHKLFLYLITYWFPYEWNWFLFIVLMFCS